jgi:hypothetical protein
MQSVASPQSWGLSRKAAAKNGGADRSSCSSLDPAAFLGSDTLSHFSRPQTREKDDLARHSYGYDTFNVTWTSYAQSETSTKHLGTLQLSSPTPPTLQRPARHRQPRPLSPRAASDTRATMGIRDILKKKDRLDEGGSSDAPDQYPYKDKDQLTPLSQLSTPEFTFIRSDTHSQEVVFPPDHPPSFGESQQQDDGYGGGQSQYLSAGGGAGTGYGGNSPNNSRSRLSLDVFRSSSYGSGGGRSRSASVSSSKSAQSQGQGGKDRPSAARRLSHRLHLQRAPSSSEAVPMDLPTIVTPEEGEPPDGLETQWEARATMLARENEKHRSTPATPSRTSSFVGSEKVVSPGYVSSKEVDDDIQEAIRLHEAEDYARSTAMFGRLADPAGANNPLSQVLYGLALRYVIAT